MSLWIRLVRPILLCLVVLGIGAAVSPVQAQDRFISLGLGTSQTRRSDLSLRGFPPGTDVTFGGATWRNEAFSGTPYYVIKVGTYFSRRSPWGIEFDYTHSKSIVRTNEEVAVRGLWNGEPIDTRELLNEKVETVRYTNGVNILSVMGLYRFVQADDRWQSYVGLGPSYYIIWSRTTIDGQERYMRYRGVGWGWQAQAGVRYRLGNSGALYAEFKYTSGPGRARTAQDGEIYSTLQTFHQTFGYAFTW